MMRKWFMLLTILIVTFISGGGNVLANTTDNTTYGSGSYGGCDYGSCTLTLTSGGATGVNVAPTAAGRCTVQSDTVSVLTNSSSGYNMTMTTATTNNAMTGSSGSINASAGTAASPTTLAMNTWGYRIDGLSSFGAGPTSAQANGSIPSVTFAGVPASNQTPTAVASTAAAANPAENTTVWYGLCANDSVLSGTYSVSVTYTAVTN
jgi:hypothetical protein